MLFSLLKDDANTAVAREHVLDILTLPLSSSSSSFPQSLLLLLLLLRKRCAQNKEKKREKRERDVCVRVRLLRNKRMTFLAEELGTRSKNCTFLVPKSDRQRAHFWFQNHQTDRGRIFGSKSSDREAHFWSVFFFIFFFLFERVFPAAWTHLFSSASFIHQNNARARTHVFFDDESVVFGDFDENCERLLLFMSFERRRENAFVRDDDFDDFDDDEEEKEQERHFL